jgi:tripartite ATP-independent transporter DctM subunit
MISLGGRALPVLVLPVILVGGIVSGFGTPAEVSSLAVVYGFVASAGTQRRLDRKAWWQTLTEGVAVSGAVLFVIASASAFAWMLSFQLFPQTVASFVLSAIGHNAVAFMLMTVFLLVVLGALLEGLPAVLILSPILFPVLSYFGVPPVHFGIVMIVSMGLGHFLPPIGIGSYVASAVAGTSVEGMMGRFWPYALILLAGIIFVALVPAISLTVPEWFHLRV